MSNEANRSTARGRPRRVTRASLREALLEIQGEVPSMAGLARQLGVGIATLYSHLRGQDELRRLAGDVAFDAWELPRAEPGMHWANWALAYACDARVMTMRNPAVSAARALAGGQLRYVERVLRQFAEFGVKPDEAIAMFRSLALLTLGVGAQLAASRLEEAQTGLNGWELFQHALAEQPEPLPLLGSLSQLELPDQDMAFDDLVWFTLVGIARGRGEVVPARA